MRLLVRSATIKAIVGGSTLQLNPRGPVVKLTFCEQSLKLQAHPPKSIVVRVGTPGLRGPKGDQGPQGAPGVGVPSDNIRENVPLLGVADGANDIFTLPPGEKAIVLFPGLKIRVHVNGHRLASTDYAMSESGGASTGFDTITLVTGPAMTGDVLEADYLKA
jgi:hypothetical protein